MSTAWTSPTRSGFETSPLPPAYRVSTVTVSDISETCFPSGEDPAELSIVLTADDGATDLVSATEGVTASSMDLELATHPRAEDVTGVHVELLGARSRSRTSAPAPTTTS